MHEPDAADDPEEGCLVRQAHAPPHLFRAGATYFITARTRDRAGTISTEGRKEQFRDALHFAAEQRGWRVVAWVVLSNHYHCILTAPSHGRPALSALLASVHRFTASAWNKEDAAPGRQVWYQYWDTCLTSEGGFWARVNYIHWNPVKHGLVTEPQRYRFSSYGEWQEREDAEIAVMEQAFPWDRLEFG